MLQDITTTLMPMLTTLLAAVGTFALAAATKWINAHATNAQTAGILDRLRDTVATVVAETEQVYVSNITEPLSVDQHKTALAAALASLKTHLGPKGLKELAVIFPPAQLEQILVSFIEARVHFAKTDAPQVLQTVEAKP